MQRENWELDTVNNRGRVTAINELINKILGIEYLTRPNFFERFSVHECAIMLIHGLESYYAHTQPNERFNFPNLPRVLDAINVREDNNEEDEESIVARRRRRIENPEDRY